LDTEPPLAALAVYSEFLFVLSLSTTIPLTSILLLVLLGCSALISGSEVAFFSLTPQDLEDLRGEKTKISHRIVVLRAMPRRLLATILITNNLVNIAIVIVSAFLINTIFPADVFMYWAQSLAKLPVVGSLADADIAQGLNFTLTVVIVTFLLVLFGEVAPKVYAKLNKMQVTRFMAQPLNVLVRMFSPISSVLVGWTQFVEKRLQNRMNGSSGDAGIKDDIDKAIDLAMPGDANSRLEAGILKSIIKFNEVPVKQIMRSRVDVVALDDEVPFKELKEVVRSQGYSRMPVYHENLDNVLGVLYVKDLIGYMDHADDFVWQDLVRAQILYVPESKKINELLKEFQSERMHMGIVVDEYGGTAGIVTLEDVMEEVIGEIKDEFDAGVEGEYRKIDRNTYLFDGKVLLNDVCRIIGVDSDILDEVRGDADSLAGLLLELTGRMPERGEEFSIAGMSFTVIAVSPRRIEKVRVRITNRDANAYE
jgi:gliding motility-associated protein GldE